MVDDRGGVGVMEWLVGDEAAVEGRTDEEVDGKVKVGGRGDFATLAGLEQDVADRLAAALCDLDMQPLQGGIAFGGIDEGGHQSRKALLAEEGLLPGEQFEQVGSQMAGCGEGEWVRRERVHGLNEQAFSRCPTTVQRGFAGPGALGNGFDREARQALVGEHLKRRA